MTDLFTWRQDRTPCVMLPFPQARRIGRAREVALIAFEMSKHPARVEAYRRRIREELARLLTYRGIDASEAASQVEAFDHVVEREFNRLMVMDKLGLLVDERGGAA